MDFRERLSKVQLQVSKLTGLLLLLFLQFGSLRLPLLFRQLGSLRFGEVPGLLLLLLLLFGPLFSPGRFFYEVSKRPSHQY
jgi:hypothetical protein